MSYNLTDLQDSETVTDLFIYANDSVTGLLGGMFMLAVFFVLLGLMMKKNDFDSALLSCSFISFVLGMLLSYAGLLTLIFPLGFLALTAFTAFYMFVVKK
jgi:uncharacterized membrane protein